MNTWVKNAGVFMFLIGSIITNFATDVLTASRLVADLNAGSNGSFPTNLTTFSTPLYFNAYTFSTGRELWKYDGTSILLTSNINDTVTDLGGGLMEGNSSSPAGMSSYQNRLYFSAFDSRRGAELWSYDGTNAIRAADINPDATDAIKANPRNSFPSEFTVFNNLLYFSANTGLNQDEYELWRFNGTNATLVTNLNPANNGSSYPKGLTVLSNALYFSADDGTHGFELVKHTGTQTLVLDINPGGSNSSAYPKYFTPLNGKLYFQALQTNGFELWQTDGSTVSLAADINPGLASSDPEFLTVFQQALYFRASDGIHGHELWKFDGTNATLAADINPAGDSFPKNLTVFKGQLFFAATDGVNGWELWKYDGINATLVTNLNLSGDAFPEALTVCDDGLYFSATTPETGYELWRCDGNHVLLAADISPGSNNSFPINLKANNGQLFFSAAKNGASDYELWSVLVAPFRVSSLDYSAGQRLISWQTLGGTTNVVQASSTVDGPFTNLSAPIFINGPTNATATNYLDSDFPPGLSRFYRIVLP